MEGDLSEPSSSATRDWKCAMSFSDSDIRLPVTDDAVSQTALDALDEIAVLEPHLGLEGQEVGEPRLVRVGAEEVVEEAECLLGLEGGLARSRGSACPASRSARCSGRGTQRSRDRPHRPRRRPRRRRSWAAPPATSASGPSRARTHPATRRSPSRGRGGRSRSGSTRGSSRAHLPVRRILVDLEAAVEAHAAEIDPVLGKAFGDVAEPLLQRPRLLIEVREDERPPLGNGDGMESQCLALEPRLALRARCGAKRAVEVVRPRVVGALDRLALAVALAQDEAAVPADVDEPAQLPIAPADEDDRCLTHDRGGEVARLGRPGRLASRTARTGRRAHRARVGARRGRCTSRTAACEAWTRAP